MISFRERSNCIRMWHALYVLKFFQTFVLFLIAGQNRVDQVAIMRYTDI